jgi:hypothetical protein
MIYKYKIDLSAGFSLTCADFENFKLDSWDRRWFSYKSKSIFKVEGLIFN